MGALGLYVEPAFSVCCVHQTTSPAGTSLANQLIGAKYKVTSSSDVEEGQSRQPNFLLYFVQSLEKNCAQYFFWLKHFFLLHVFCEAFKLCIRKYGV